MDMDGPLGSQACPTAYNNCSSAFINLSNYIPRLSNLLFDTGIKPF